MMSMRARQWLRTGLPWLLVAALAAQQAIAADTDWSRTLERIAQSVVSIKVDQVRAFDTELNASAQATGFIVDAERGLILTNRHVVTPGPVTAEAIFLNREEVQLHAVYRDPVHDFGIYRYDPAKLQFIKPVALPLVPEAAQIGREIRVVGNNAGEQLSILAGTLARLDRGAPQYGSGRYNDFNTFYIQAASGTSGGSSGSPVIDIQGRVLALNAGGATDAASSFFLPLDRVKRALELIQQGRPVARGTLQTEFRYRPYDELRRLGLEAAVEAEARRAHPDYTGMLVVENVQPGSGADGRIEPGDILVRVNGRLVTSFEPLAAVLDDSVGQPIDLELQRGGHSFTVKLEVGNLHAITPNAYVEIGDAVLHTLSWQMARHFNVPVRGLFLASAGYIFDAAGVPRGAVIVSVNGVRMDGSADFLRLAPGLADGAQMIVRYFTIDDPVRVQVATVRMDRRWFPARSCRRNDASGYWDCSDLPAPAAPADKPEPMDARFPATTDPVVAALAPSLVAISFDMPYSVSGVLERNYHGTGLIIDAARGLVITDRNTVPVSMGDVRLTFAGVIEVPAEVVYVHPLHNLAVIQYDPALIGRTPVRAARLAPAPLQVDEKVGIVGYDEGSNLRIRRTSIAGVDPLQLPLSRTVRFRESNLEVATLVNPPADLVGVMADESGRVRGLWASFASSNGRELVQESRGIASDLIAETRALLQAGAVLHSLEVEFVPQTLAAARRLGLSAEWVRRIRNADPTASKVLGVARLVGGSDAAGKLQPGDILLTVDEQIVTRFREVERAVATRAAVRVRVWRAGGEHTLEIRTAGLGGHDLARIVRWAGATLQPPHRALSAQRGIAPEGIYVSFYTFGSPATRYGLLPGRRIVEVDGRPTPDLDAFLRIVAGRADRSSVRIKTLSWNGQADVITLKLDRHYWPGYELTRTSAGWERRALE